MATKEAAAKTPSKAAPRDASPAATRSRAKTKTPAKASRSKSATARTPRTARKTKKEDKAASSDASEPATDDEGLALKKVNVKKVAKTVAEKVKVAAAEVSLSGNKDDTATKLILRITYVFLLVAGVLLIMFPKKVEETKSFGANKEAFETSLVRALGLVVVCLALQFIAAAQGVATDQKHSLQYGMFCWLGLAAVAIVFMDEGKVKDDPEAKKETQMLVAFSAIMLACSLWACYFS
ncbi:Hypothetical Protein FCC1311_052842 [Hondaea fermentalgiana]|uniref:Uncharacterized protein n=1 Tax=Hondaea fermentalgiana TaxID=2315210 RepID=A0A2R5GDP3_9STRA|nr:Hypothetical Protein FCC1311_052842 [Hondaea fermentalgiana]|eukprot:GBG29062.1 Hypothetical Protein FCC1311_052842 [Hondaea fermentalgiana]